MIFLFFSAFVVGLSGAMMPGSLLTYTIRRALTSGTRAGFVIIAGHALLELGIVLLILLGFGIVLQSGPAQIGIGLAGGVLLAVMGIHMVRGSVLGRITVETGGGQAETGNMFLAGVLISAANPAFLLWWAVIGLGFFTQAFQSLGYSGVMIFYLGHITADFSWYGLVSFLVGKTRRFLREKPFRAAIAVLGCLLVCFGVKFIAGAAAGLAALL